MTELPTSRGWRRREISGKWEEVCLRQFLRESAAIRTHPVSQSRESGEKQRQRAVLGLAQTEAAFLSGQDSTAGILTAKTQSSNIKRLKLVNGIPLTYYSLLITMLDITHTSLHCLKGELLIV